jgi:hypothetical protein
MGYNHCSVHVFPLILADIQGNNNDYNNNNNIISGSSGSSSGSSSGTAAEIILRVKIGRNRSLACFVFLPFDVPTFRD